MRLTCLIDSLGSGGAQRQLCTLAVLLKRRGWDVSMVTYHAFDFFLPMLAQEGIPAVCLEAASLPRKILRLRQWLRREPHDVVLAFLDAPAFYAELAALPARKWGLVVSERNAVPETRRFPQRALKALHRIADYVTTNSHTNRLLLEQSQPALKDHVLTVYNAVDLDTFSPRPSASHDETALRLAVAARYEPQKNVQGLIEAVAIARGKAPQLKVRVDWYGHVPRQEDDSDPANVYYGARRFLEQHGLQETVKLHPASPAIRDAYCDADAVVLPSFFEGLPNTVCEAMACGRPILMSNVCDAGNLVHDGHNGLLFDPTSPDDIARAILRFAACGPAERAAMGERSRAMAERMFAPEPFAARYAEILAAAAARSRLRLDHWVPEVPASAERSANAF